MKKIMLLLFFFALISGKGFTSDRSNVWPAKALLPKKKSNAVEILPAIKSRMASLYDPCTSVAPKAKKKAATSKRKVSVAARLKGHEKLEANGHQHGVMLDNGKEVRFYERSEIEWDVLLPAKK